MYMENNMLPVKSNSMDYIKSCGTVTFTQKCTIFSDYFNISNFPREMLLFWAHIVAKQLLLLDIR